MIKCLTCGGRHSKGSGPYKWCHSHLNPAYVARVVANHKAGAHAAGQSHKDCPRCKGGEQQQLDV